MGATAYPNLWLDRISRRLGISYLAGIVFLGTLPPVIGSVVASYLFGDFAASSPTRADVIAGTVLFVPVPLISLLGARYVTRKVAELGEYSRTLGSGISLEKHEERLASIKFPAILCASLGVFATTSFITAIG